MGALDQAGRAPAPDGHVAALIGTPPPLDEGEARRFLRLLDSNAEEFLFQTFTDAEDKPQPDHLAKVWPLSAFTQGLQKFYLGGAGVWVTINAAAGGRKAEHVTAVRAVWQEDDDGFEGDFPLEPSIVNESSPGRYHRYWLVEGDWPADERGRADFAGVMARMVADYGSDSGAKDISRVLRVPGFVNRKRGEPFMVRMVGGNGLRYSRAEILGAFPPLATAPGQVTGRHRPNGHAKPWGADFFANVNALALQRLGAWVPVLHPTAHNQYAPNWRVTSKDLDRDLEEDLAYTPMGIKDFGEEIGLTAVDAVRKYGAPATATDAALWLCRHIGVEPAALGFRKAKGERSQDRLKSEEVPPAAPLVIRNVWDILTTAPRPRCWHIEHWLPGDDVTGLFADGGEGKTQLGLQLAYCTATGMPWLGMSLRSGPALYLSAEEPDNELHYRLDQIARGIAPLPGAERHAFEVVSRAREDSLLCTFGNGGIQLTPLFNELAQRVGDLKLKLLGLDAAADLFGGDENNRAHVRAFIATLRKLGIDHQCAVLIAGHPSRDGLKTGLGYSGSTAWHNSLRARWYFKTPKANKESKPPAGEDEDDDPDRDLRELLLEKTNRGRRGQKIMLRWRDGFFGVEHGETDLLNLIEAKGRFMDLLAHYTRQGRTISHKSKANNYAPTVFARDRTGRRFSRDAYTAAMNALFGEDRLTVIRGPLDVQPAKRNEMIVAK